MCCFFFTYLPSRSVPDFTVVRMEAVQNMCMSQVSQKGMMKRANYIHTWAGNGREDRTPIIHSTTPDTQRLFFFLQVVFIVCLRIANFLQVQVTHSCNEIRK